MKASSAPRIMQFGGDALFYSLLDPLLQQLGERQGCALKVTAVAGWPFGCARAARLEEGYTLVTSGVEHGLKAQRVQQIFTIDKLVEPVSEYQRYLASGCSRELLVIFVGEEMSACDTSNAAVDITTTCPSDTAGALFALLRARYEALGEGYPLIFVSLNAPATVIKAAIVDLAKRRRESHRFVAFLASLHFLEAVGDRLSCFDGGKMEFHAERYACLAIAEDEKLSCLLPLDQLRSEGKYVADLSAERRFYASARMLAEVFLRLAELFKLTLSQFKKQHEHFIAGLIAELSAVVDLGEEGSARLQARFKNPYLTLDHLAGAPSGTANFWRLARGRSLQGCGFIQFAAELHLEKGSAPVRLVRQKCEIEAEIQRLERRVEISALGLADGS